MATYSSFEFIILNSNGSSGTSADGKTITTYTYPTNTYEWNAPARTARSQLLPAYTSSRQQTRLVRLWSDNNHEVHNDRGGCACPGATASLFRAIIMNLYGVLI